MSYEIETTLRRVNGRLDLLALCIDDSDGIVTQVYRQSPEPVDPTIVAEVDALVRANAEKAYQIKTETRSANKAEWFLRDLINDFIRGK